MALPCTLWEFPEPVGARYKVGLRMEGPRVAQKLVMAIVLLPSFQYLPGLSGAPDGGRKFWARWVAQLPPRTGSGWAGPDQCADTDVGCGMGHFTFAFGVY